MAYGTVLVVDDNEEMREAVAMLLKAEGFDVLTVENGEEALETLRSRRDVRCVVLDLEMPVLDGAGFRRAQLAESELAPIPVIVMSGRPNASKLCADLRVTECLAKPVSPDALIAAVARFREPIAAS